MKKKLIVITCPHCGKEYLPSEIFIPKAFFGQPYIIYRDDNEKIIDIAGTSLDTTETYCCDKCNNEFKVQTKISFSTDSSQNLDFNSDYHRNIE